MIGMHMRQLISAYLRGALVHFMVPLTFIKEAFFKEALYEYHTKLPHVTKCWQNLQKNKKELKSNPEYFVSFGLSTDGENSSRQEDRKISSSSSSIWSSKWSSI
jgi:hypothetical protein